MVTITMIVWIVISSFLLFIILETGISLWLNNWSFEFRLSKLKGFSIKKYIKIKHGKKEGKRYTE